MVARTAVEPHRVALVDFDWADADLIPELLRLPELDVRRIAGRSARDPGLRVAALCGVPHTLELDLLLRDGLDLALVGRSSSRRARIHELLGQVGAQVREPRAFLAEHRPPPEAPRDDGLELTSLTADELSSQVDSAIPDLVPEPGGRGLDLPPGLEDPAGPMRSWHDVATRLSSAWAQRAPARPSIPAAANPWNSAEGFRERIEELVERHDRDGQSFVVHRLRLDSGPGLMEALSSDLARDARPGEALCRVGRDVLLVLSPGPPSFYSEILDRVRRAWDRWSERDPEDSRTWGCERIELASREDAGLFRFVIEGWLRKR